MLIGNRSQARYLLQLAAACECSMLAAICYDILSERHAQATHIAEQIGTCCIDIDANVVDATHHCVVESMLEFGLVYIVLVLTPPILFGSILTSSDNGSISLLPIDTAPRTVTSSSGNSSRAIFEAEYIDAPSSLTR